METLKDLYNKADKTKHTLAEIVGYELTDTEGWKYIKEPFCIFLYKRETAKADLIYFKYECLDRSNLNSLYNGYYKGIIEKNSGAIYDIDTLASNTLMSY